MLEILLLDDLGTFVCVFSFFYGHEVLKCGLNRVFHKEWPPKHSKIVCLGGPFFMKHPVFHALEYAISCSRIWGKSSMYLGRKARRPW